MIFSNVTCPWTTYVQIRCKKQNDILCVDLQNRIEPYRSFAGKTDYPDATTKPKKYEKMVRSVRNRVFRQYFLMCSEKK